MALNFKEPQTITATYRIITPMFIGDANQAATGISPASVKGALRFWWRALSWARVYKNAVHSETDALKLLHKEESKLFGSSAENGKAASFVLRLDTNEIATARNTDWPTGRQNDASSYLGLGLWKMGQQDQREYINEDQLFSVSLILSSEVSALESESLQAALKLWGLVGGLGSRARRAFGSVSIVSLGEQKYTFTDVDGYLSELKNLLSNSVFDGVQLPPYSAISESTQVGIGKRLYGNARLAHAGLGNAFKEYRGQPSSLRGAKKRVFGMPYSGGGRAENNARRASPLLMHVHPVGDGFVVSTLFLPAVFHSEPSLNSVDFSIAKGFLKSLPEAILS